MYIFIALFALTCAYPIEPQNGFFKLLVTTNLTNSNCTSKCFVITDYDGTMTDSNDGNFSWNVIIDGINSAINLEHNDTFHHMPNHLLYKRHPSYLYGSTVKCTATKRDAYESNITGYYQSLCVSASNKKSNKSSCFSANSTILIDVNNTGFYNAIKLKDSIKYYGKPMLTCLKNGTVTRGKFMVNVHVDHYIYEEFLQIFLNTTYLQVTHNHLVYIYTNGMLQLTFARNINIGHQMIVLSRNNSYHMETVSHINTIMAFGIYSPMPENIGHDIFVNNILVSPFSTYDNFFTNQIHFIYAYLSAFNYSGFL